MIDKEIGARILGNAGILIATQIVTKLLGTIFTIAVARKLGVEEYGLYAFASTFGNVFGLVAIFGFPRLVTREVARETEETNEILGNILPLEAILSTLMVMAMVGTLLLLDYPIHRIRIVTIAGSGML